MSADLCADPEHLRSSGRRLVQVADDVRSGALEGVVDCGRSTDSVSTALGELRQRVEGLARALAETGARLERVGQDFSATDEASDARISALTRRLGGA